MKKNLILTTSIAVAGALGLGGVALGVNALSLKQASPAAPVPVVSSASPKTSSTAPASNATKSVADIVTYLIEEEKLAHDVYTVLAEKWGSNTFANIVKSETGHQSQMASVLTALGIADPRSGELGVFTNPDLQALYNKLVAQGSTSLTEAYWVGIAIEEMDIADLTEDMALVSDQQVLSAMDILLKGSYNHLAAFQKKLG